MVKSAVFELANATPVEVLPAIEILNEVGDVTDIPGGMTNSTRSVVPATTDTLCAVIVALGVLPTEGVNETLTLDAGIVPLGKFEPTTVIDETPGCPEDGVASGDKDTWVVCAEEVQATKSVIATAMETRTRGWTRDTDFRNAMIQDTMFPPGAAIHRVPVRARSIPPG
jgi:hypothetical protein